MSDHYSGHDPATGCALIAIAVIVLIVVAAIGLAVLAGVLP